jgi:hypothetical protein
VLKEDLQWGWGSLGTGLRVTGKRLPTETNADQHNTPSSDLLKAHRKQNTTGIRFLRHCMPKWKMWLEMKKLGEFLHVCKKCTRCGAVGGYN